MFARAHRGVFDFIAAALCLWAAAYHTPAGALVRSLVARVTKSADTSKPLLAYYSGGVYDAQDVQVPPLAPTNSPVPVIDNVPPGTALGRGVYATVLRLGPSANATALAVAQRYHLAGVATPDDAAALVARVKNDLQTDDAAVLSLFTGYDVALYATQRAKAEGRPLTLESLVLQLPPSSAAALAAASASLSLGTAYGLGWPVMAKTPVTSPFGWRTHPITGAQQLHSGVDLAVPEGTPVKVVADGVVRRASEDKLNGRMIIVDHGHGVATAYCHNATLLVAVGAVVKAGEVISESGTTGRSTGPHLHYQLNLAAKPTDPFVFRDQRTLPEMPRPPSPTDASRLKSAFDHVGVAPEAAGTDMPQSFSEQLVASCRLLSQLAKMEIDWPLPISERLSRESNRLWCSPRAGLRVRKMELDHLVASVHLPYSRRSAEMGQHEDGICRPTFQSQTKPRARRVWRLAFQLS